MDLLIYTSRKIRSIIILFHDPQNNTNVFNEKLKHEKV